MSIIPLPIFKDIKKNIKKNNPLIQVIIGPRQVGKTTGIKLLLKEFESSSVLYVSADGEISSPSEWLYKQWIEAKTKSKKCILVIDEIQKVENWSEAVKNLWDNQDKEKTSIRLVLLGSSSIMLQKGLNESLVGRYQVHKIYHWNHIYSKKAYNLSFDEYLIYGGYPGSYQFINNKIEWLNYLKESIINPVIGKDILLYSRIKSPALFKQCFDIVCSYPAQEISYTKLLGQLQDKGNTDLVKYYLELLEGAFLIKQLFKYTNKKFLTKSSSPKIIPLCPALYSITVDADITPEEKGRLFEVLISNELIKLPGQIYYWRERNFEVDFVYKFGKKLFALEVKSGRRKESKGLLKFKEKFKHATCYIVTPENYTEIIGELAYLSGVKNL